MSKGFDVIEIAVVKKIIAKSNNDKMDEVHGEY